MENYAVNKKTLADVYRNGLGLLLLPEEEGGIVPDAKEPTQSTHMTAEEAKSSDQSPPPGRVG